MLEGQHRALAHQVARKDFRPSAVALELEELLKRNLGMKARYEPARLCMGRSLAVGSPPAPVQHPGAEAQRPIPGEFLFGKELDFWLAVLIMDGQFGPDPSAEAIRDHVEAHWHRGAQLLLEDWEHSQRDDVTFLLRLTDLLPHSPAATPRAAAPGAVRLRVGPVSVSFDAARQPVDFVINGPGSSPHIALMGKVGSGKTRTGTFLAVEILRQARIPMIFIDPKGEFVREGKVVGELAQAGLSISPIEVGNEPIPLDFLPDPSVGVTGIAKAAMQFRDSITSTCRGVGAIQQNLLLRAVETVIQMPLGRDLAAIRQAYSHELASQAKGQDSVLSRLEELSGSLKVFAPKLSPAEFFSRSWVISLGQLQSDELKRAAMLLLIDAMRAHTLAQPDTEVQGGYRRLRHLLVIDEARRILSDKKYQSLVELVRQGRSKGQVVLLLSQDPSDFDGQADDFTTQLGAVIAFKCAQGDRGLRALKGAYGRKLQPNEFSETYLPTGVAFVKLPDRQPERIVCWEASGGGVG